MRESKWNKKRRQDGIQGSGPIDCDLRWSSFCGTIRVSGVHREGAMDDLAYCQRRVAEYEAFRGEALFNEEK
jgi:hypothetical protein